MSVSDVAITPVRTSVTVECDVATAFDVFTAGIDSWWPRTHHIGKAPLQETVIETKLHGRVYGKCVDGSECDWATVMEWEPPQRFVLAWQISPDWKYEPDLAKASEVDVRFTALEGGHTRVDLEHRHFERHGLGAQTLRAKVGDPNGWSGLLRLFSQCAGKGER